MAILERQPTGVEYFSDCTNDWLDRGDAHARMRAGVRYHLGFEVGEFIDLKYPGDGYDGAMTLMSLLQANEPATLLPARGSTLILNNAAPRADTYGTNTNGRDVCAAVLNKRSLVVSTFAPRFFELANRLGLVTSVRMFNANQVLRWAVREDMLSADQADDMRNDPFRGASYIPWLAQTILTSGFVMEHTVHELGEPVPPRGVVARFDSEPFGPNIYLDTLTDEVTAAFQSGEDELLLQNGDRIRCYPSFAAIPPNHLGAVPASSRFGQRRFVMIAVQGGRAGEVLWQKRGLNLRLDAQVLHESCLRQPVAISG